VFTFAPYTNGIDRLRHPPAEQVASTPGPRHSRQAGPDGGVELREHRLFTGVREDTNLLPAGSRSSIPLDAPDAVLDLAATGVDGADPA
jgi:hypothetical protein